MVPHKGGRILRLRSVFTVVNNTNHSIHLLAQLGTKTAHPRLDSKGAFAMDAPSEQETQESPFLLRGGESFRLPLSLLHRSAIDTTGQSLGSLLIRPAELGPVRAALDDLSHLQPEYVNYTTDPIQLSSIVSHTAKLLNSSFVEFKPDGTIASSSGEENGMQVGKLSGLRTYYLKYNFRICCIFLQFLIFVYHISPVTLMFLRCVATLRLALGGTAIEVM